MKTMPTPDHTEHLPRSKPLTVPALLGMRDAGEKIAALTCYDASFATLMNACGVELLLVGDSLGNVVQGQGTTLPVSVADIAYHTASVARGNRTAVLAADMPFGSYATPQAAYDNAVQLMRAGAHIVKLEGGGWLCETVRFLTERGIPVFAHLGLTPQSVHQLGGFKVQGKTPQSAALLKADAHALQAAGASLLLLEAIPAALGREVSQLLAIPTIGIGAGPDCSGQILVMHDMLNVFPGKKARFVRDFMTGQASIGGAFTAYVGAVKEQFFPAPQHCF